jgi:hypothetical protein
MKRRGYVVITQQIEGNERVGFDAYYYSDLKYFTTREAALRHGARERGSDDFNIGTVEDGKLVAFGWGDWDFSVEHGDEEPHGGYDLDEIARQTFILGHGWPS